MPRKIHWRDLTRGLIAMAAILGLAIYILFFARVGDIRGDKVPLYMATDDATGVIRGTQVWLAGENIGVVKSIDYREPSVDTLNRIALRMDILKERLSLIRRDSKADIRPGYTLIASNVVFIEPGTADSPPLRAGDTIFTHPRATTEQISATFGKLKAEINDLGDDVKGISAKMQSPNTSFGALHRNGMPALSATSAGFNKLKNQMSGGNGTIGLAMNNGLMSRATGVMASVDSLRALLNSSSGSIGRFKRDSTLGRTIAGLMARVDSLQSLAANPIETIAKSHNDNTLTRELQRMHTELAALMQDLKRHPMRYIVF